MKITLSTTAEKFQYFQKYQNYEPTFVEAKSNGEIVFTLDVTGLNVDNIATLMFLLGQDYMLDNLKKNMNYGKPTEEDYAYTEQSF